jgi:phage gp45-like
MQGYQNQDTRVEVESSRYENGRLLVTVKGMAGERFEDLPWEEPHGFHSRPAAGATGFMTAPGGRRDQAVVRMAHDPSKVPPVEPGETAMYDVSGNVVKMTATGLDVTHSGPITFNGDVKINGNVEIDGALHVTGPIDSDEPDPEDE